MSGKYNSIHGSYWDQLKPPQFQSSKALLQVHPFQPCSSEPNPAREDVGSRSNSLRFEERMSGGVFAIGAKKVFAGVKFRQKIQVW